MGELRLISTAVEPPTSDSACLDAFDRELDYVFATLRRLGAAPHEVEDLAQEVFVVLYRKWDTLDTSRPLRPYLFGIAFRIFSAQRRRRIREVLSPNFEPDADGSDPEDALQSKQAVELLLAALESVPLARRAVVIMHDLDETPIADIAHHLCITRFGAYARLRKGRKELAAAVRTRLRGGAST
jgi:RNA polymerase sigma-70 factor (ECF subfamily)